MREEKMTVSEYCTFKRLANAFLLQFTVVITTSTHVTIKASAKDLEKYGY